MLLLKRFTPLLALAMTIPGAGAAYGQEYPTKPIRLVTGVAGGGGDFEARIIAPGISGPLGQPVIIDNRAARFTGEIVAKAPPDGYTLLIAGAAFTFAPLLEKMPYDPLKDFSPISILESSPNVFVVQPSLGVNAVKDFIALAKSKPGVLNYGSPSIGSSGHLAAELLKSMARIDIVHVPYKGGAAVITAALRGEVQGAFPTVSAATPHLKSGKLKALAVTGAQPFALVPGVPTMAAAGVPGYDFASMDFMLAPAKTPSVVINRLNREVARLLSQPEVKEKYTNAGLEARSSTPQELGARIQSDYVKIGRLIKEAGIRPE